MGPGSRTASDIILAYYIPSLVGSNYVVKFVKSIICEDSQIYSFLEIFLKYIILATLPELH